MAKDKESKAAENEEKMDDRAGCETGRGRSGGCQCPWCLALDRIERSKKRHQPFFDHLRAAEGEVLKAVRSLIDQRLEESEPGQGERKATKIKVN